MERGPADITRNSAVQQIVEAIQSQRDRNLAVFWDLENVTPGADSVFLDALMELISEYGRPVLLQAFADWTKFKRQSRKLVENNFQLIHTPNPRKGKNSSDMNLISYGIETALKFPWIDVFVLISGDSDFRPLVQSLRRSGKLVYIVCDSKVADDTMLAMADGFKDYKAMIADFNEPESKEEIEEGEEEDPDLLKKAFQTLRYAVKTLIEEEKEPTYSTTKIKMQIIDPEFNERKLGFSKFSKFVAEAENNNVVKRTVKRSSGQVLINLSQKYEKPRSNEPEYKSSLLKAIQSQESDEDGWVVAAQIGEKINQKKFGFSKLKKMLLHAEKLGIVETKSEGLLLYARPAREK